LRESLEVKLFVESRQLAIESKSEQLVGEIHQHAVVSGGMIGEGSFPLGVVVIRLGFPADSRR
jgi:hypothetical protein